LIETAVLRIVLHVVHGSWTSEFPKFVAFIIYIFTACRNTFVRCMTILFLVNRTIHGVGALITVLIAAFVLIDQRNIDRETRDIILLSFLEEQQGQLTENRHVSYLAGHQFFSLELHFPVVECRHTPALVFQERARISRAVCVSVRPVFDRCICYQLVQT